MLRLLGCYYSLPNLDSALLYCSLYCCRSLCGVSYRTCMLLHRLFSSMKTALLLLRQQITRSVNACNEQNNSTEYMVHLTLSPASPLPYSLLACPVRVVYSNCLPLHILQSCNILSLLYYIYELIDDD
jgi:hypothetical protein